MRTNEGEKRIGIPVDAKVTFGPSVPGPKDKLMEVETTTPFASIVEQKTTFCY